MRSNNPYIKVHFEIESRKSTDVLLPIDLLEHSAVPCHSIVIDNPNTQVSRTHFLKKIFYNYMCVYNHAMRFYRFHRLGSLHMVLFLIQQFEFMHSRG